jgi:polyhydroxyalkanoate synthase
MTPFFRLLGRIGRSPPVGKTPADVVHAENKWRLLRYRSERRAKHPKTPLLLVPSLINRHYVLDLMPKKSFAEYLVGQGHDVFIIDWGTPGDEDRYVTFDDICDRALGRALRQTVRLAGTERAHVLGYCMGGTLTTIHAAVHPEHVASLALLAAPIGFSDDGLLATWTRTKSFDVSALVDALGNVPWPLMQASFHLLKPTLNMTKAVGLVDRAWDDEFLDGFFAIEAWGNDNVSFPGECYRRYIEDLYRKDALVKGEFLLSGRAVKLENIKCPTLVVSFRHDHIVPWQSAAVVLEKIASKDQKHIHLNGGHVGAVISKKASQTLWPELSAWWTERDGVRVVQARAAGRR